ncbi:MAG: hypothetical protein M1834_003400 [Cirrosporium novae-zelandiae]|nr:MAG: hypothetical protein M1834_003400 [Cirrosporium novae-zelandiae]
MPPKTSEAGPSKRKRRVITEQRRAQNRVAQKNYRQPFILRQLAVDITKYPTNFPVGEKQKLRLLELEGFVNLLATSGPPNISQPAIPDHLPRGLESDSGNVDRAATISNLSDLEYIPEGQLINNDTKGKNKDTYDSTSELVVANVSGNYSEPCVSVNTTSTRNSSGIGLGTFDINPSGSIAYPHVVEGTQSEDIISDDLVEARVLDLDLLEDNPVTLDPSGLDYPTFSTFGASASQTQYERKDITPFWDANSGFDIPPDYNPRSYGPNNPHQIASRRNIQLDDIIRAGMNVLGLQYRNCEVPMTTSSTWQYQPVVRHARTDSSPTQVQSNSPRLPSPIRNHLRIHSLNLYAACFINTDVLGVSRDDVHHPDVKSFFYQPGISPDHISTYQQAFSHIKESLRPTSAQITHNHYFYIDLLPFPKFRERMIVLGSMDPPFFDEDELMCDIDNNGLICWGAVGGGTGAPWDIRSWEAEPWFLKKWSMLIGGKDSELHSQSNWWREMRGEDAIEVLE